MNTTQKVREFLARRFAIDEAEIHSDSTLDRLGIDSLATLELMFDLEDEFGIRLDPAGHAIRTVEDVVTLIDRQLAAQCAAAA